MRPLDFVGGTLRPAGASAEAVNAARNGDVNWNAVLRLAGMHRMLPSLWSALRAAGVLRPVPDGVRAFLEQRAPARIHVAVALEDAYNGNAALARDLLDHIRDAVAALNTAGIEPMPLKGTHYIVTGLIADPAARAMVDVDLLVAEDAMPAAHEALTAIGYVQSSGVYSPAHHGRAYIKPGLAGAVELHRRPLGGAGSPLLSPDDLSGSALPIDWCGLRFRAPSPSLAALHSILHAQVVDRMHVGGILALRSLHETALLDAAYEIDWSTLRRTLSKQRLDGVLTAHVYQLHVLFGRPCPRGFAPTSRDRFHHVRCVFTQRLAARGQRALRSILDVRADLSADRMRELFPAEKRSTARRKHLSRKIGLFLRPPSKARRW